MFRFLTIVAAVATTTSALAAETRPLEASATLANATAPAELTLKRNGAAFVLTEGSRLQFGLAMQARLDDGEPNIKIVGSDVGLKDGGKTGEAAANDRPSVSITSELSGKYDFAYAIDAQGILAQNAAAACSAAFNAGAGEGSERTAQLTATAVWRVTTGRFNFPWTQYDRVAVNEDMRANPDFYGERETVFRDIAVPVTLTCRNDAAPKVALKAAPEPVKASTVKAAPAPKAESTKAENGQPENTKPGGSEAESSKPEGAKILPASLASGDVTADAVPQPQRPQCSGGMIRETSLEAGGYICLCPGNTQRVSTAANAFACQKLARR